MLTRDKNPRRSFVHPLMTNIFARKFSLSGGGVGLAQAIHQSIRVLLYVTRTVARWRYRIYVLTDNKGACSNIVANRLVTILALAGNERQTLKF